MRNFVMMCDNMGDMSQHFYQEHNIKVMSLTYTMDSVTYDATHTLSSQTFYQKMRDGSMPTTSQINPQMAKEAFCEVLKEDVDILCLCFSSGLSGTYESCAIAAQQLNEAGHHIVVVDSLSACLGQGLLLYYAVKMKEAGKTMAEIVNWLEQNKLHVAHLVVADDLFHLMRGGRISKSSAMIGSMLSIKPIIQMNDEGKLIATGKSHGRKKAMKTLIALMKKQMGSRMKDNEIFMVAHADCEADAIALAEMVKQETGIAQYDIQPIGPVIGAHTGPGTIALFCLCDQRMR